MADAAQRRQYDRAATLLTNLSPQARAYLQDRLKRPRGPRAAGLRWPTIEELRDPRRREEACEMIEHLCRALGVEKRKRLSRKRSDAAFRPLLNAPALRRHVSKRQPERNFIMNFETTWLEADRLEACPHRAPRGR